jgi:hypothetical protein
VTASKSPETGINQPSLAQQPEVEPLKVSESLPVTVKAASEGNVDDWLIVLRQVIESTKIDEILMTVQETVINMKPDSKFELISNKASDPLELYFQIGDHETLKEKFHKFISSYEVNYDPKYFVLRNCLLTAEERTKSNTNIARYYTPIRAKLGDIYYMLNQVQFKKVLAMTPKESVCIKAVKFLPNGDCIEHNMSFSHDKFPNDPNQFERFEVLANPIYYMKTETGLRAKSFNYVIPKSKMLMMMLKAIMNKSYNGTFKAISEIIEAKPNTPEALRQMESEFTSA